MEAFDRYKAARQLAEAMLALMEEREATLVGDHELTENQLLSLRLTVMDLIAVTTIVATSIERGLPTEGMIQMHVKHVEAGIEQVAKGMLKEKMRGRR